MFVYKKAAILREIAAFLFVVVEMLCYSKF